MVSEQPQETGHMCSHQTGRQYLYPFLFSYRHNKLHMLHLVRHALFQPTTYKWLHEGWPGGRGVARSVDPKDTPLAFHAQLTVPVGTAPLISIFWTAPSLSCPSSGSAKGFSVLWPQPAKKHTKRPFCFKMVNRPTRLTSHTSWHCLMACRAWGKRMEKSIPLDVTRKQMKKCKQSR